MRKTNNELKIRTLSVVLLFTLSAIFVSLPLVNAQATKVTYAFIGAIPNPVGVNQQVLLHVGIPDALGSTEMGWEGLTVSVTKPDGSSETLGPYRTDSTGGTGAVYIPTMAGTYQFKTHFPEQTITVTSFFDPVGYEQTFLESESDVLELIVQNEPIDYYQGHLLPNEYWTRPIDAQLREWYTISGNWLSPTPILPTTNLYAPYNDGPESAHILWTMPVGDTMGGLAGGATTTHSYGIGDAYEGKFVGSVIIGGVLFYNKFEDGQPQQQVVAVDLHTGETLYTKTLMNNLRISHGQVLYWDDVNYHGAFSYLWATSGTSWHAFEPLSGEWRYTMTNVPSGTNYYGPNGEIIKYTVDTMGGSMSQWNTTTVVTGGNAAWTSGSWGRNVKGVTLNASETGTDWTVTIPTGLPGSVRVAKPLDRIVGAAISETEVTIWALSLEPGDEGELLFQETWQAPTSWDTGDQTISWAAASLDEYVAVLYSKELHQYYAFSLETGEYLWGETTPEHYLNMYDRISTINYGKLLSSGASGIVYAYDLEDGDVAWTYEAEDPYQEILWANNWWLQQLFISDGKLYLGHVEHSPINPLPRGAPFVCLDIETGDEVWRIDGAFRQTCWGGHAIIGDSVIALMNTYDQSIYALGKGPTETTVTANPKISTLGTSVLVEGSVMDISPGTQEYALTSRFPSGVPAVSDQNMDAWMKYVYMQFEKPTATGVTVKLEAVDPNNNYQFLGETTTDTEGNFGFMFTPEVPGKYMIIATFEQTNSYYGSHQITYIGVDPAPTSAASIEPEEPEEIVEPVIEPTETPIISTEVAIALAIVAVAIIAAIVFVVLRRRK